MVNLCELDKIAEEIIKELHNWIWFKCQKTASECVNDLLKLDFDELLERISSRHRNSNFTSYRAYVESQVWLYLLDLRKRLKYM